MACRNNYHDWFDDFSSQNLARNRGNGQAWLMAWPRTRCWSGRQVGSVGSMEFLPEDWMENPWSFPWIKRRFFWNGDFRRLGKAWGFEKSRTWNFGRQLPIQDVGTSCVVGFPLGNPRTKWRFLAGTSSINGGFSWIFQPAMFDCQTVILFDRNTWTRAGLQHIVMVSRRRMTPEMIVSTVTTSKSRSYFSFGEVW